MMALLWNLFYIILFMSLVGSVFTLVSLLVQKVLRLALPLWFGVCGIVFFLVPLIFPSLWLVSPEETEWVHGYQVASVVWISGVLFFLAYFMIRNALAYHALKKYVVCQDERINRIFHNCVAASRLKKTPALYFGTLAEPACVVTIFQPAVILNQAILQQLTENEISIVLCHEITHIRRTHPAFQRLFELAGILHWFNPFVWIARNEFASQCEMDCDRQALFMLGERTSPVDYARAMLRLMELSAKQHRFGHDNLEALGFFLAKQRLGFILNPPSKRLRTIGMALLAVLIALTLAFSAFFSRSYFYPYPALTSATGYSETAQ